MTPRRWLLMALSLGSLVMLSYGVIAVVFSVPVTDDMVAENALAEPPPPAGTRAVVSPLVNPGDVVTWRDHAPEAAWLMLSDRPVTLPAQAESPRLVEALAYVSVLHDRSYREPVITLHNLTAADAAGTITYNETVNVTELGNGRNGFLVKTASGRDIQFVETARVMGTVERFESSAWSFGLVGLGIFGFVAPLVVLIVTATRGAAGRPEPGIPRGAPAGACPECRRPIPAKADFCTGCGAWLR